MVKQKGFTLVELILAMAFFSFILLFVIVGFVQINRSYTRGITTKEVQNTARELMENICLAIRNSEANSIETFNTVPGRLRLCAGTTRFGWNMADAGGNFTSEVYGDTGGIISISRTSTGACQDPIALNASGGNGTQSLVPDNIVVQYLEVRRLGTSNSYTVELVISTDGRANPLDFSTFGPNATCDIQTGDQFCDVARLETVVTARN